MVNWEEEGHITEESLETLLVKDGTNRFRFRTPNESAVLGNKIKNRIIDCVSSCILIGSRARRESRIQPKVLHFEYINIYI